MDYIALFEKYLGPWKRNGREIIFQCYRCDKHTGHYNLSVNPQTGNWRCYKCEFRDDNGKGTAKHFARIMGETEELTAPGGPVKVKTESPFNQYLATRVYTYLYKKMELRPEDIETVTKERGLRHPEWFGIKVCRGAAQILKERFHPDTLIASGLFYKRRDTLVAHTSISDGRIMIPYFDEYKNVIFTRFRRGGSDDDGLKYMSPMWSEQGKRFWGKVLPDVTTVVLTEGEFKAMASVEAKVYCWGLPGMGSSHGAVIEAIKKSDIRYAIICFDTQKDPADQLNIDGAARSLANKIIKQTGISVFKATLPLDDRVASGEKMDIDSFLYYHTPEEYKAVLRQARKLI